MVKKTTTMLIEALMLVIVNGLMTPRSAMKMAPYTLWKFWPVK